MNDHSDPIQTTSASAAQLAVCPRCGTQLRLTRSISDQTPIKCYSCQAVFCLAPIETAPVATTEAPLTNGPRPMPPPAQRPTEFSSPPFPLSNRPDQQFPPTAPPASATVQRLTSPPMAPAPAAAPAPAPAVPASPRLNAPPLPAQPPLAPPAAPATGPAVAPPKMRKVLQLGPQETIVAGVLLVALVAGGFAAYSMFFARGPSNPEDSTDPGHGTAVVAGKSNSPPISLEKPAIIPDGLRTIPRVQPLPPDAAAKSAALVGIWDARSDDGSISIFELREDESAILMLATDDPGMSPKLEGRWALTGLEGNTAKIDIIYTTTGLEVHRMIVDLDLPHALTVVTSAFRGHVNRVDQRYVRRTKAPS